MYFRSWSSGAGLGIVYLLLLRTTTTVYPSIELDSVYAMQLNAFLFIASKTQDQ